MEYAGHRHRPWTSGGEGVKRTGWRKHSAHHWTGEPGSSLYKLGERWAQDKNPEKSVNQEKKSQHKEI